MRTPELAGRVVRAVVSGTRLPVTVKIRSGWDEQNMNAVEIARIAEAEGACAVTVHARTRSQMYMGRADWSMIGRVKRAVSIPVLGNGDVASGDDAIRMMRETGCDGVMVGRAAQGNPWIFREVLCAIQGRTYCPPRPSERVYAALRHADMLSALIGVRHAVREMRKQLAWYVSGLHGCAKLREQINRIESLSGLRDALAIFAAQADDSL